MHSNIQTFQRVPRLSAFFSCSCALFCAKKTAGGGIPNVQTFEPSNLPNLPHPSHCSQTALVPQSAKAREFFSYPGKQLRSPRCLRILSGHREPFYDVPGQTPTRSGSQVVPGSTVLTLGLSRVTRATHPCRTERALASGKDAGKCRVGKAGSVRLG
jgi:hypothetical protein